VRPRWPSGLAVEVILEAVDRPAFILGPRGTIEAANGAGVALLGHGCGTVRQTLRECRMHPHDDAQFSLTPLTVKGIANYSLAIRKTRQPSVSDKLAAALKRWRLTPRQAQVLELLASGATNKEIATGLACAKVTVENHVTELFRRSGARSRSELVARLHSIV